MRGHLQKLEYIFLKVAIENLLNWNYDLVRLTPAEMKCF